MASTLLTSSLLGFVGSEELLSATSTSYSLGRKSLPALYNSPGSYGAGKALVALSKSDVFDGPHASVDPAALASSLPLRSGPKYIGAFSGSIIPTTGPLANILLEHSRQMAIKTIAGRSTTPSSITVVRLPDAPDSEVHPAPRVNAPVIIPIAASAAGAAACGVIGDWTTFSMIILGMVAGGVSSVALRQGDLTFTRPLTTPGVPAGDGYLEAGNEIIVLKGSEGAVASVTRGRFTLRYKNKPTLTWTQSCGQFLSAQCLIQLLLVPQGTFIGRCIFLLTMVVAWVYNAYVARQEEIAWKRLVLEDLLKAPTMERYSLGTRTTAAVFLMQMLKPTNVEEQLALLLPNNTPVWRFWRQTVAQKLRDETPDFVGVQTSGFNADESKLLKTLFGDAQAAVAGFAQFATAKY